MLRQRSSDLSVDAAKDELRTLIASGALPEAVGTEAITRLEQFALIATEAGVTLAVVAERYAHRVYQDAAPGTWLQKKDGAWAKK